MVDVSGTDTARPDLRIGDAFAQSVACGKVILIDLVITSLDVNDNVTINACKLSEKTRVT